MPPKKFGESKDRLLLSGHPAPSERIETAMNRSKSYPWPSDLEGHPDRPCIVGTVSTDSGIQSLSTHIPEDCDIVELRSDLLSHPTADLFQAADALSKAGKSVIFTARLQREGGNWEEDSQERADLLIQAMGHAQFIDVEASSSFADIVIQAAQEKDNTVILSTHDFESTPTLPDLQDRCRMTEPLNQVIRKAATRLRSESDIAILKSLIAEQPEQLICAMGMGPLGPRSRIELADAGSCLTYGYLDTPAAPGQLSCTELMSHFQ